MTRPIQILRVALTLLLAGLVAGALAEFVVGVIIGYPAHTPTRVFRLHDKLGVFNNLYWESPRAKVWIVEGGDNTYQFNNVGLSGSDVIQKPDTRYLYVVGSSWVGAVEVPNADGATSVLQRLLDSSHSVYQVINLGQAGSDPYVSWFRVRFYERIFPPSFVILVLESFYSTWLSDHALPLDFTLPPFFGQEERRTGIRKVVSELRGKSAFVNLLERGLLQIHVDRPADASPPGANDVPDAHEESIPEGLTECLDRYQHDFGNHFLVVSMIPDSARESMLSQLCTSKGIAFAGSTSILESKNRFEGYGHLNREGNHELGKLLYESVQSRIREH